MDSIWNRGVIKYLQTKWFSTKDMHDAMVPILGDDDQSLSTVLKWTAEFSRERKTLENYPKSGYPTTDSTEVNIDRVYHMMMKDRPLTRNKMADFIGISWDTWEYSTHWPWRDKCFWSVRATSSDTWTKSLTSRQNLTLFEAGFIQRSLNSDDCCVHHFDPENREKRKSMPL